MFASLSHGPRFKTSLLGYKKEAYQDFLYTSRWKAK